MHMINFALYNLKQGVMKDYFYLNAEEMVRISRTLKGAEIKMLYAMMYCMSKQETKLFINNVESRKLMKDLGFDKTPERISALLGALVKKGVIKREINGVYSLPDSLFRTTLEQTEK